MTLDDAIKHCREVASSECNECSDEHFQLMNWLIELKKLRTFKKDIMEVVLK